MQTYDLKHYQQNCTMASAEPWNTHHMVDNSCEDERAEKMDLRDYGNPPVPQQFKAIWQKYHNELDLPF